MPSISRSIKRDTCRSRLDRFMLCVFVVHPEICQWIDNEWHDWDYCRLWHIRRLTKTSWKSFVMQNKYCRKVIDSRTPQYINWLPCLARLVLATQEKHMSDVLNIDTVNRVNCCRRDRVIFCRFTYRLDTILLHIRSHVLSKLHPFGLCSSNAASGISFLFTSCVWTVWRAAHSSRAYDGHDVRVDQCVHVQVVRIKWIVDSFSAVSCRWHEADSSIRWNAYIRWSALAMTIRQHFECNWLMLHSVQINRLVCAWTS
jgi:hypothetical protein